jgi:type II secretory pathway pseudopilin PulG
LGILLAIAIPALTGYIKKAEWAGMEQQLKMQRTAFQAMIDFQYSTDSMMQAEANNWATSDRNFYIINRQSGGFSVNALTDHGKQQYEILTGDTQSFAQANSAARLWFQRPEFFTNDSGAIRIYRYTDVNYFGSNDQLVAFIVDDVDSTEMVVDDAICSAFGTRIKAKEAGLTNGINIFRYNSSTSYTRLNP